MRNIRITAALLLSGLLLLTGCGAPAEVKQKAKERLNTYRQPFIDSVKAAYGDDASLGSIKCNVSTRVGSPVPDVSYAVNETLTGKIRIGLHTYKAEYYPSTGTLKDTVHTDQIHKELLMSLPIDQSKVYDSKLIDNIYREPMFPAETDTLAKAMASDSSNHLLFTVVTSEDLSVYTEESFDTPAMQVISSGVIPCRIKIFSVTDKSKVSSLLGKSNEMEIYSFSHPTIYYNNTYQDAFEVFHIRNIIKLQNKCDPERPLEMTFCE